MIYLKNWLSTILMNWHLGNRTLLLGLLIVVLPSCSNNLRSIVGISPKPKPVPRVLIPPPKPSPLSLNEIKWVVYSDKDIKALIKILKTKAQFCLTSQGYESLAKNMQEIDRMLKQLRALIVYYESRLK